MNKFLLSGMLLLIAATGALAQSTDFSDVPLPSCKNDDPSIFLTAVAPGEMHRFRFAAAYAAFDVLDKIKQIALDCHQDANCTPVNRSKSEIAYRGAWFFIEKLYAQSVDKEEKKIILDKWDASLADKTTPIYLLEHQIGSLDWGWNHDFLTPTFTNLFIGSKDEEIFNSCLGVFSQHGEEIDLPILNQKLDALRADVNIDAALRTRRVQSIERTIRDIKRGPVGSPSRIGPATNRETIDPLLYLPPQG